MNPATNIEVIGKSRPPRVGDLFTFRVRGVGFLFGRVVSTTALVFEGVPMVLIYVYKPIQQDHLQVPDISRPDLLIPPLIINRLPWSRGYFKTLANTPIEPHERLPQHCVWDHHTDTCFNEHRQRVTRTEPCGRLGLDSYRSFDDAISKALGISFAPDDV